MPAISPTKQMFRSLQRTAAKPSIRLTLLLILLMAFALRLYRIDSSPLRGDEAFTVRYWSAPPSEVLHQLAWVEPHPFGAFFAFWVWKSVAGESEFAMRMLPALLNMLGAAAMYALARRLRLGVLAGLTAAVLWAINPGLIWHSQDVRNYAPWAGLSATALWLLVRAADRNRRIDWVLYAVAELLALYLFFLEAFMLLVHGLYILWLAQRSHGAAADTRWWRFPPLRSFIWVCSACLIFLIPWLYQVYRLAGSGYGGTAEGATLRGLLNFGTEWLLTIPPAGDFPPVLAMLLLPALVGAALLWQWSSRSRAATLAVMMLLLLPLLLVLVSTRLDVFRARYILAVMPAVFLVIAGLTADARYSLLRSIRRLLLPLLMIGNIIVLSRYYNGMLPKAPDWRGLRDVLISEVGSMDALVVAAADLQGTIDPAFEYYYEAAHEVLPRAGVDLIEEVDELLARYPTVYLVDQGESFAAAALETSGDQLEERWVSGFRISSYRSAAVQAREIQHSLALDVAGGRVMGWSLEGDRSSASEVYVLIYWDIAVQDAAIPWKVFIHIIDASGQIVSQADLPVRREAGRSVFSLVKPEGAPEGYRLRFGLYREDTGERAVITDVRTGDLLGDYADLGVVLARPS